MSWFHYKNKQHYYWCIEDDIADILIVRTPTLDENMLEIEDDFNYEGIIRCYYHENEDMNWEKIDYFACSSIIKAHENDFIKVEQENEILICLMVRLFHL